MGLKTTALVLAVAFGVAIATAGLAVTPQFNKGYVGSVVGEQKGHGETIEWTVKGLVLRKTRVTRTGVLWGASYMARAGRVTVDVREKASGGCTYSSVHKSFSVAGVPRMVTPDAVVDFSTVRGWYFEGTLWLKKKFTIVQTCPSDVQRWKVELPPLLSGGQKGGRPGQRLIGNWRERDRNQYGTTTTTWSWRLRARA